MPGVDPADEESDGSQHAEREHRATTSCGDPGAGHPQGAGSLVVPTDQGPGLHVVPFEQGSHRCAACLARGAGHNDVGEGQAGWYLAIVAVADGDVTQGEFSAKHLRVLRGSAEGVQQFMGLMARGFALATR